MSEILMPALSPTMEQGTLAKWFVAVGDTVRPGDVIAEIETDKATMEVEASEEGVIAELLVPAGTEEVPVQTPIARFSAEAGSAARGTSASAVSPSPAPKPSAPEAGPRLSPSVRRIVTEERLDPTQIRGSGREGRLLKADALEAAASRQPVALDATPLARKLAQAAGIDLSARDNRPGNRLRKADLVRPREIEPAHPSPSQGEGASPPRVASRAPAIDGAYDLIPLDGMRRTIAERMTDSFRDIPHFPLTIDLEIDAVLDVRNQVNAALAPDGFKVSINDILIKAAALALRQVPEANASYTPDGIVLHHHADISVAVAIDGGLITPIIRAAETKGLAAISREMLDLAERARSRRLKPEEYQGGTFSISNLGMFGIKSFSSIINAPQGAILSIGAAEPRPVVRDDTVTIARVMTCTLTCDHRAMDGVAGARLLSAVRQMVTEPIRLMA
jgi:pyruvate dehydrogenase E2 component (dihydrolipoamide acetyltransferase)